MVDFAPSQMGIRYQNYQTLISPCPESNHLTLMTVLWHLNGQGLITKDNYVYYI